MDAVPQVISNAWLASVAANPVLGAGGMVLLIVALQYLKQFFPFLGGGAGKEPDEPEASSRGRRMPDIGEQLLEHAACIADHLRMANEIKKREAEVLERIERLLLTRWERERERPTAQPIRRAPRAGE